MSRIACLLVFVLLYFLFFFFWVLLPEVIIPRRHHFNHCLLFWLRIVFLFVWAIFTLRILFICLLDFLLFQDHLFRKDLISWIQSRRRLFYSDTMIKGWHLASDGSVSIALERYVSVLIVILALVALSFRLIILRLIHLIRLHRHIIQIWEALAVSGCLAVSYGLVGGLRTRLLASLSLCQSLNGVIQLLILLLIHTTFPLGSTRRCIIFL